ncbi:hypothetical protein PR048_021042 [Dryococelus australis]|uniref:Uncharacterized protein n=1 Tax=Dryococelus australis TaxID=614101 RepID=A0ABQ9GX48_9NEOP|nr:hypothetical protein PR048_021042 [Dryococelus australis]
MELGRGGGQEIEREQGKVEGVGQKCWRLRHEEAWPGSGAKDTNANVAKVRGPPTRRDMAQERANAKGDTGARIKCRIYARITKLESKFFV